MRLLTPHLCLPSVALLSDDWLWEQGIRGIILDLDETLVAFQQSDPPAEIKDWLQRVGARFQLFVVSNNRRSTRVQSIAEPLGLPFLHLAAKPLRGGFRRALREMKLSPEQVVVIGDQLFTDVLGGRRLGALTVLVHPLSPERVWHRKWMRRAEGLCLRSFQNPVHASEWTQTSSQNLEGNHGNETV